MENRIIDLIATKFRVDRAKIGLETNFFKELGADSLEMLSFVTEIEKEFNVQVDGKYVDDLYCVKNIVNFLVDRGASA